MGLKAAFSQLSPSKSHQTEQSPPLLPVSKKWEPRKIGSIRAWSDVHSVLPNGSGQTWPNPAAPNFPFDKSPGMTHGLSGSAAAWPQGGGREHAWQYVAPTKGFCKCQKGLSYIFHAYTSEGLITYRVSVSRSFFLGTGASGLPFCLGLGYKSQLGSLFLRMAPGSIRKQLGFFELGSKLKALPSCPSLHDFMYILVHSPIHSTNIY